MAHVHRWCLLGAVTIGTDRRAKDQHRLWGKALESTNDLARPLNIDSECPHAVALTCWRQNGGQMNHRFDPIYGLPDGSGIRDIALDHLNTLDAVEPGVIHCRKVKHPHRPVLVSQS